MKSENRDIEYRVNSIHGGEWLEHLVSSLGSAHTAGGEWLAYLVLTLGSAYILGGVPFGLIIGPSSYPQGKWLNHAVLGPADTPRGEWLDHSVS